MERKHFWQGVGFATFFGTAIVYSVTDIPIFIDVILASVLLLSIFLGQ